MFGSRRLSFCQLDPCCSVLVSGIAVSVSDLEEQREHDEQEAVQEDDEGEEPVEIDPADVYTLDDFLAEDEKLESFRRRIGDKLKAKFEGASSEPPSHRQRQSGPQMYIPRNREAGHDDLVANYFSANPNYTDEMFRRRFRMTQPLFLRIVGVLSDWDLFLPKEWMGRDGHSPLQKCTAAIRWLGYGTPADQLDEVLKIAASTSLEFLGCLWSS